MLRFRDLEVFVFEFWVLRFRSRVLRFRALGCFVFDLGCFVLRSSFSSASFSKLPMNDTPVPIWIIANNEGTVLSAHCLACKAGLAECCSHIGSVLF